VLPHVRIKMFQELRQAGAPANSFIETLLHVQSNLSLDESFFNVRRRVWGGADLPCRPGCAATSWLECPKLESLRIFHEPMDECMRTFPPALRAVTAQRAIPIARGSWFQCMRKIFLPPAVEHKNRPITFHSGKFAFMVPNAYVNRNFVRKFVRIIIGLWLCGMLVAAKAETYNLTDGTSINGDVISFNDDGIVFRTGDDKYTDRVLWTKFSQDALKLLAKNPKLRDLATPFIETPPPPHPELKVQVHDVSRLELPPRQSVIGALFSSFMGIILLLLIYAANIYAGFEIAIFRGRPIGLVAGLAAVFPIVVPIIFLAIPTRVEGSALQTDMQMETGAPAGATQAAPSAPGDSSAPGAEGQAGSATTETVQVASAPALPETQIFQRGQFTFNRRFIETKFSGFFGMTRHGASKDMVLIVKTGRAQHIVERISRIAANDAHFEVLVGAARQEIMVPFGEIQEIQLKHKNA
jgi:hypothetical protein